MVRFSIISKICSPAILASYSIQKNMPVADMLGPGFDIAAAGAAGSGRGQRQKASAALWRR